MKYAVLHVTLLGFLSWGLVACSPSAPIKNAAATGSRPSPTPPSPSAKACPTGPLLPGGANAVIDWVDFLRFNGRDYISGLDEQANPLTLRTSQLGRVVTRIRCSLTENNDYRHAAPPFVDGTASLLPSGTPVYEVRGYSVRCRLAAYVHGEPRSYLAHHDVNGRSQPEACAL